MTHHNRYAIAFLAAAWLALGGAGCFHVHESSSSSGRGHGPPPWAPAHGYRHKHPSGVDLVFDTGLGVYVVVDLPGIYFQSDRFYRKLNGGWGAAPGPNGPWLAIASSELPPGLRQGSGPGLSNHPGKGKKNSH